MRPASVRGNLVSLQVQGRPLSTLMGRLWLLWADSWQCLGAGLAQGLTMDFPRGAAHGGARSRLPSGRSSLGIWTLHLAEAAALQVHRGSESAFPAQNLEPKQLEKQAMFAFGAVACRALGCVSPPGLCWFDLACIIGCSVSPRCVCINSRISA